MTRPISVEDHRLAAKRRLPRFLFDYIDGGSYGEQTLGANVADLRALRLRQRVMRDISSIDTRRTLFGTSFDIPIGLGPVGLAGLYARRGERKAVAAAQAHNVPFTLSTVSGCGLKEVQAASARPFWFQLYMIRDRGFMTELLQQANEAGCSALVFTVDMPLPGTRYRDYRSGLAGAPGLAGASRRTLQAISRPGWAWRVGLFGGPHTLGNVAPVLKGKSGLEDFMAWMAANFDPSVTWHDLDWVRSQWSGPIIVKGILEAEDALQAAACGAEGLVVSNHGGRQLDSAASAVAALPAIAAAVGDRMTVLADGGVRSGLDALKLLALGAQGVLLGRAWAYALAGGGAAGVRQLLQSLEAELRAGMALTGCRSLDEITAGILLRPGEPSGRRQD